MADQLSKSGKKRLSRGIEELVFELANLSPKDMAGLPCPAEIRAELAVVKPLKAGARKRQIKYIARLVRESDEGAAALFAFLEQRKGSRLKQINEFHELERLRDAIIDEAISRHEESKVDRGGSGMANSASVAVNEDGPTAEAARRFPGLDQRELWTTAMQFARTRNPKYPREVFRMLKAALERERFVRNRAGNTVFIRNQ